jgi:hypothetical protein
VPVSSTSRFVLRISRRTTLVFLSVSPTPSLLTVSGETLETLDKLGQILGVLDLDGTLHNGGDGELHDLHVA